MSAKLKVLCLHGYLQNGEMFRGKIGSWRKALKSRLEFEFIDAPHLVHEAGEDEIKNAGGRPGGRSWWLWEDSGNQPRPSKSASYTDWEPSLHVLTEALSSPKEPYDGLIGFSQGATAAALFLACAQLQDLDVPLPKFVILVGGFLPHDPGFAESIIKGAPSTASLHLFGENDTLVEPSRSKNLMGSFSSPICVGFQHGGAHMMPTCSGPVKHQIISFLGKLVEGDSAQNASACNGLSNGQVDSDANLAKK
ncbi:hypothetical protein BSKO_07408 [Bryopsis sp. KO-2023]|nr:hypothetical protein BSKO_07408 [Bryopsis sp. KO-2023]